MLFENESVGFILLAVSIGLMVISFIEALISKKWLKGVLYFICYSFLLVLTWLIFFAVAMFIGTTTPSNATVEFYNKKLNYHIASDQPIQLDAPCKQEQYYESFTGDLDATCIFELSNADYALLTSRIKANKSFKKLNLKNFEHQIGLNKLECSKRITFKNSGYQSNNDGNYASIIFASDNKYCLFNISYF